MDHDQRFKELIREFFDSFMELFFAEWATPMDFSKIEWLDKELYHDPPEGPRHILDMVAKLPYTDPQQESSTALILVHLEIESPDRNTRLKPRLPFYYHFLRDKYELPVLPIVLYLKVAMDGIGVDAQVERIGTLEVNRFQYLYVGLPGLDAVEYLEGDNWLGVALSALMRIPEERIAWLGAEALRRLSEAALNQHQRFLLGECVEAYLPLDEQRKREFEELLLQESYQGVKAMNVTSYERGLEQGLEQGVAVGQVKLALSVLESRFDPLSKEVRDAVAAMSEEALATLLLKVGTASSLSELGLPEPAEDKEQR